MSSEREMSFEEAGQTLDTRIAEFQRKVDTAMTSNGHNQEIHEISDRLTKLCDELIELRANENLDEKEKVGQLNGLTERLVELEAMFSVAA